MKLLSQIQDFWKVTGNTIADTLCFVKQRIPVLRLPSAGVLAVQYNLPYVLWGYPVTWKIQNRDDPLQASDTARL